MLGNLPGVIDRIQAVVLHALRPETNPLVDELLDERRPFVVHFHAPELEIRSHFLHPGQLVPGSRDVYDHVSLSLAAVHPLEQVRIVVDAVLVDLHRAPHRVGHRRPLKEYFLGLAHRHQVGKPVLNHQHRVGVDQHCQRKLVRVARLPAGDLLYPLGKVYTYKPLVVNLDQVVREVVQPFPLQRPALSRLRVAQVNQLEVYLAHHVPPRFQPRQRPLLWPVTHLVHNRRMGKDAKGALARQIPNHVLRIPAGLHNHDMRVFGCAWNKRVGHETDRVQTDAVASLALPVVQVVANQQTRYPLAVHTRTAHPAVA